MILEVPNFVDANTIESIRTSVRQFLPKDRTSVYNRDGKTVLISKIPELKETDLLLSEIFSKAQREIVLSKYKPPYPSGDSGYEYHIYEPGDVCHYHADHEFSASFEEAPTMLRYASVVLHLNTVEEGGELIFPSQNKKIKTEKGKVVIFPPYGMFGHYVSPSNQEREIIVTWFVYSNLKISTANQC